MVKNTGFDPTAILLPGAIKTIKKEEYTGPSATSQAEKRTVSETPVFVAPALAPTMPPKAAQPVAQPAETKQPELLLDDISSLFN